MSHSVDEAYFSRHAGYYLLGGVIACAAGLVTLSVSGQGSSFGMGLMFLTVGIMLKRTPVVAFGDDFVQVRAAPLRAKKLVRFSDIWAVRPKGKGIVLETRGGEVFVPLGHLNERDAALIRDRIAVARGTAQLAAAMPTAV